MSTVKKLVDEASNELTIYLRKVTSSIEQIIRLREYREQATGIERVELERITGLCESYLDDLNILFNSVSYLSQERNEGKLILTKDGQYCIEGLDVVLKESYPLELLIEDENRVASWQIGRIIRDHTNDALCFLGEGSKRCRLKSGQQAAIRLGSIIKLALKSTCSGHHA